MKNILKIVLVVIGTIIGAGFASGKEVAIFFFEYGYSGILGMLIATILFFFIIVKILKYSIEYNIENYNDLKINLIIKYGVNIFLLITYYIMVAGFAAFLLQEYYIPVFLGSIIINAIGYVTFIKGVNGVIKANMYLIPVLIAFLIHICFKNVDNSIYNLYENELFTRSIGNLPIIKGLISAILYVGYNSVILIPILVSMKLEVEKSKNANKTIVCIAVISSIVFLGLGLGIILLLAQGDSKIMELEIPIINLIKRDGVIYSRCFSIAIMVAIFTSAISVGYGFLKNVTHTTKNYKIGLIFITVSSIFVSNIGFSVLVKLLYPILGIIGILQMVILYFTYNIEEMPSERLNSSSSVRR